MDADGDNPRNLTNHNSLDQTPDWSPDGRWIAFSSNRDGDWEIFVMNADGTNPSNLTNHSARDGRPDWSPDGNQIAFCSDREGNLEIFVMNADGTNLINLTNHLAVDDAPDWSPDGMQIAFDSYRDKDWEIYVMNADGTNPINLTQNPDAFDYHPAWEPAPTLSVASKGKLAILWGKVKRGNTDGIRGRMCEEESVKEENYEKLIAETAEADLLPLYWAFNTRCELPLGLDKSGTSR